MRKTNLNSLLKSNSGLIGYLPAIVVVIIYCILQLRQINIDFWNDEIYTFKHFTFVPFYTILTDYHAPNNHVFLNLTNKIYLKVIGVKDFFSVFDYPYKLRLLALFYSIVSFFYVYKIGEKFFNKTIALLSIIILSTTIPYYTHALQIRGYGLSTMFLAAIIYYCFKYWSVKAKKLLLLIGLLTTLLMYTIPSNLYCIIGTLLFLFFHTLIAWLFKPKGVKYSLSLLYNHPSFHLSIAIIGGILLSLLLYAPVFKDVFMNEHIERRLPPFEFSQLKYYVTNVFVGFMSNRSILLFLFISGLILNSRIYRPWANYISLMLFTLLTPFLLVFILGTAAPFRIFAPLAPLFCLLISIGVYSFWRLIPGLEKFDLVFIMAVQCYSLVIFGYEIQKIDKKLMSDIIDGERHQDFYYQYYSSHFYPLREMQFFKTNYYKNSTPVLQVEYEPHDVPNYLDKLGINRYKNADLDSLLDLTDSLYIITNHPNKLRNSNHEIKLLNHQLNYHNIVLCKRNKISYNHINTELKRIKNKYKDSIRYVFNLPFSSLIGNFCDSNDCYFIHKAKKFGEIISFIDTKPYVCYFQTNTQIESDLLNILKDDHKQVIAQEKNQNYSHILLRKIKKEPTTISPFYFNDFEKSDLYQAGHLYDSIYSYKGRNSEKLDKDHGFSSGINVPNNALAHTKAFSYNVSFYSKFKEGDGGLIVLDVNRNGKTVSWKAVTMNDYYSERNEWRKIITILTPDIELQPEDIVKVYVWNNNGKDIWIDNLKIEVE